MKKEEALAAKVERSRCRGKLLTALESDEIITSMTLGEAGQFILDTSTWDDYWNDIQRNFQSASELISDLHASWRKYIISGFDSALRQEYCYRYALLLDAFLDECLTGSQSAEKKAVLNRVLAFECFGIKGPQMESPLAAATSTLRNPTYLLNKLIRPKAVDDPQYLPLITGPGKFSSALFYYYRQHKLSLDSGLSILLFLSTSVRDRPQSFFIINMLEPKNGS